MPCTCTVIAGRNLAFSSVSAVRVYAGAPLPATATDDEGEGVCLKVVNVPQGAGGTLSTRTQVMKRERGSPALPRDTCDLRSP
jgi:hypothetical protein